MYTHHERKFSLASGEAVYWNRISGYGVEHDFQYLVVPTKKQAAEIAQKVADDDVAFSEECDREKEALPELRPIDRSGLAASLRSLDRIMTEEAE